MTEPQGSNRAAKRRQQVEAQPRLTFTADEVAARLGISRSAVYDCIARGEIPAKRLGRRVVVVRAALDAFLAEGYGASPAAARRRGRIS
jgi:excisionase family DNA binding protein